MLSVIYSLLLAKIANHYVVAFEVRLARLLQATPCSKQFFLRNYPNT